MIQSKTTSDFDRSFFSEAKVCDISVEPTMISFIATRMGVLVGHPWHAGDMTIYYLPTPVRITFLRPIRSIREIHPHPPVENPDKWPPIIMQEDGPFEASQGKTITFGFECTLIDPPAYVDWEIDAAGFEMEIAAGENLC
jgi:hypothetical protein